MIRSSAGTKTGSERTRASDTTIVKVWLKLIHFAVNVTLKENNLIRIDIIFGHVIRWVANAWISKIKNTSAWIYINPSEASRSGRYFCLLNYAGLQPVKSHLLHFVETVVINRLKKPMIDESDAHQNLIPFFLRIWMANGRMRFFHWWKKNWDMELPKWINSDFFEENLASLRFRKPTF